LTREELITMTEKERVEEAVEATENFKKCPFCGGGYNGYTL